MGCLHLSLLLLFIGWQVWSGTVRVLPLLAAATTGATTCPPLTHSTHAPTHPRTHPTHPPHAPTPRTHATLVGSGRLTAWFDGDVTRTANRWKVVTLVAISLVGTFVWDRIVTAIFAPDIAKIMFKEASQTTIADLLPVFTTMFKVVAAVGIFASGNIFLWGGVAWWYYKRRAAAQ